MQGNRLCIYQKYHIYASVSLEDVWGFDFGTLLISNFSKIRENLPNFHITTQGIPKFVSKPPTNYRVRVGTFLI